MQAAQAAKDLVADLPGGEEDYLDACRAYVDLIYGRLLAAKGGGKQYFLDKTPANALVLLFITKLYPRARYVVLIRHPAAIFSSYANSFLDGDDQAARRFNPILNRYVPAMARLLRENAVPLVRVAYEDLVRRPQEEMRRLCDFLALPFEASMIEYGERELQGRGLGDPIGVRRHSRPVTDSVERWVEELAAAPEKFAVVREMVTAIDDRDLDTWGFSRATLFAAVERAAARGGGRLPPARTWNRFVLERKLLTFLRRHARGNSAERFIRRVRALCDILLRG